MSLRCWVAGTPGKPRAIRSRDRQSWWRREPPRRRAQPKNDGMGKQKRRGGCSGALSKHALVLRLAAHEVCISPRKHERTNDSQDYAANVEVDDLVLISDPVVDRSRCNRTHDANDDVGDPALLAVCAGELAPKPTDKRAKNDP